MNSISIKGTFFLIVALSCWTESYSTDASSTLDSQPIIIAEAPNIVEMLEAAGVDNKNIISAISPPITKKYYLSHRYEPRLHMSSEPAETEYNSLPLRAVFVGDHKPTKTRDFYKLSPNAITQMPKQIEDLGQEFGQPAVARKTAQELRNMLEQYPLIQYKKPISFIIITKISGNKYVTVGQNTFISQVWERAGGINLMAQPQIQTMSLLEIKNLRPRLLIISKSDEIIQKNFPEAEVTVINPEIFFEYAPSLLKQGLPEAYSIIKKVSSH